MNMAQAVSAVLMRSRKGLVFDSHFVIAQIIKHHTDAYIHFARHSETTKHMHSRIAKLIGASGLVIQLKQFDSWSETICGKPDKCALWQRL